MGGGGMSGGMINIPGTAYGGVTDPGALQIADGFRVIPTILIAQRYDSNVFFVPPTPGLKPDDFVTTTVPQVRGLYVGDFVTVNATAAAVGEYYAKNTGLSYVGANAGAVLDFSKLLSRWWAGTQMTVTESFSKTPQPPAFLTGDLSGEGGVNPYVRGFQAGRVNTESNNIGSMLSVPISQTVNLTGSYYNGFMKFGSVDVQQVGILVNTSYTTYMAGLSKKLSPQDAVSLRFTGSEYDTRPQGVFTTRGGVLVWLHQFSQNSSLTTTGGAQLMEGEFSGVPFAPVIAPTGGLSFLWKDSATSVLLGYSVGVVPSFQFQSAALLSHTATFTLTQQTAIPELLGLVSLNYGRANEYGGSSSPASAISYTSFGGTGGVTYKFSSKTFMGLTYSYSKFDTAFGVNRFGFDRQVVQMTLTQAFY